METLDRFVNYLNNEVGGEGPLPDLLHGEFGAAMRDSLNRHYAEDRQKGGLRMSGIGKPAVVQALNKLGYSELPPKGKSRYIFMTGDFFENWLEIMLAAYDGIEIVNTQGSVSFEGIGGHYDYLVDVDGKLVLIEAKTMSENYSRMFMRSPGDERGYMSQLALYRESLMYEYGVDDLPSVWICLNKANSDISLIEPDYNALPWYVSRARNVIARMENVHTHADVLEQFRVPPPRNEIYRKNETGMQILPTSMAYSPFAPCFYNLSDGLNGYGKPTRYVDSINTDAAKMVEELEMLVEYGQIGYENA